MESNSLCSTCRAPEPYPEVRTEGRNPRYAAAMLSNFGGANSELSAVNSYFYNRLVTVGIPEIASAFHEISIVEMHHMEIFATLALQLGADPRPWSLQQGRRIWWSPDFIQYTRKLGPLIHGSIQSERAAIQKYEGQLRWIRDPGIVANLQHILQDEKLHLTLFQSLYEAYGNRLHR